MGSQPGLSALGHAHWSDDPLELLAQLRETRAYLDYMIERAVGDARSQGASWAEVAQRLDVARQVAWRKYAALVG